ncbi:MAG TPA: DUF5060 domain-containing protein [Bryobacteraceae bacterium]|nr:DUF5060 domain-containing protein [Bryobacteraceae bacterium]
MLARLPLLILASVPVLAQTPCEGTPAYTPCEFVFELSPADLAAHPNPYSSVKLEAEFRSPHFKTFLMPAFWDGGSKMVLRFTPTESGQWLYRFSSNLAAVEGKAGSFNAAESDAAGFIQPANFHHWWTDKKKPHLWMGYIDDRFAFGGAQEFDQALDEAAQNEFTHFRGSILGGDADKNRVYLGPDKPNPAYFDELDRRILAIHKRGLVTDLILGSNPDYIASLFPDWQARERFIRYIVARYAPMNITWQGLEEFEDYSGGRALLKELGAALAKIDPYQHPRSSNAKVTSSPLLADGWMNFVIENSTDDTIGSVEHQFYQVPFVGVTDAQHLWNTAMDGEYPEFHGPQPVLCKHWFDLVSGSRYWELEPYFYTDGARAVALEDAEYLAYIEHPGPPIEVEVEKHGYDIMWFDPATGEYQEKKKYSGEHFTGEAPDKGRAWVVLVSREGHVESMNRSYRFDSREVPLIQTIENNPQKVPFVLEEPSSHTLAAAKPVQFSVKLTRATRATRSMMYLWTAEVPTDGQGFRVIGTGSPGTFVIPPSVAQSFPAVLAIHLTALNANGKAYAADRVYELAK